MPRIATALILALTITSLPADDGKSAFTAVIADLRGPVNIQHGPAGKESKASIGLRLQVGDTVETGEGAAATIFLSGGQLLEILEGSRIRITKDLHAESGSDKRLASMSISSLRVLERGVWTMSAPGGSRLVGGLRGPAVPEAEPGVSGVLPLSPRHEVVLDARPSFYWTGSEATVRVVVARDNRIVWRSPKSIGSVRLPAGGEGLSHGTYTWWIETADTSRPLTPKVSFEVAGEEVIAGAAALEAALGERGIEPGAGTLPEFLRCAYYLEVGAWSPAILALTDAEAGSPEGAYLEKCASTARAGMGLRPVHQEALIELAVRRTRSEPSS